MKVYRFTLFLFILLFSCSSRPSHSRLESPTVRVVDDVEEALPMIDGRPISELPIAAPQLKEVWLEGQALLELKPQPLARNSNAEQSAAWFRTFGDWTRLFFAQRQRLLKKMVPLSEGFHGRLFSSLLFANIDSRFINNLQAIKLPETLSKASAMYLQNAIDLRISMLTDALVSELKGAQIGLENAHVSLEAWKEICEAELLRFSKQNKRYDRVALAEKTRWMQSLSDAWPVECQTQGVSKFSEYEGEPNHSSKRQRVAIFIDEDSLEGVFKDDPRGFSTFSKRVYKSVAKLAKHATLISMKEMKLAKTLVAEKRLSKQSRTCAAAPPLEAVLQNEYENLVIARVGRSDIMFSCTDWGTRKRKPDCEEETRFTLNVDVSAYGTLNNFEPITNQVEVKSGAQGLPKTWINAAREIGEITADRIGSGFGGLSGGGHSNISKRFYDKWYQNDWFEKTKTLNDNIAFLECNSAPSPISYDLDWQISPSGQSDGVELNWISAPEKQADTIKSCMEKVLRETPWRCPMSGKPETLSSRVCERKSYKWWD